MKRAIFPFIVVTVICLMNTQSVAYAANADCKPLYGGGVTKEQSCNGKSTAAAKATPTPAKAKATPTLTKAPAKTNTTKGGLPVLSPTPVTKTPSTGPEVLGLMALAPAAALGYYLRKRS